MDEKTEENVTKLKLLPVYIKEIPDGKSFKIISPLSFKYFVVRWIYIQEATDNPFYSGSMKIFDYSEIFLLDETKRECYIDGYRHLKLSNRNSLIWGGLVKSEMKVPVYFFCVSSRFKGKDGGGVYQVGFLCIKVPNVKTEQLLIKLTTLYGYSGYRTFDSFPW